MTVNKYTALVLAIVLSQNFKVNAQVQNQPQQVPVEAVFQLLKMDCGTNAQLDEFNLLIRGLETSQVSLLRQALRQGLNDRQQATIVKQASVRFKAKQSWLKAQGGEVLDQETIERLLRQTEQETVNLAVYRANLKQRENAIRALGIIGNREDIKLIKEAVKKEPKLKQIASQAVTQLRQGVVE